MARVWPGQVEDHVDVERREDAARRSQPLADLGRVAVFRQPVHAGEQPVVEALHADRQPRHAGGAIALQDFRLQVVRVGLDRNRLHLRRRANQVEGLDQFIRVDRRGAAADVDVAEAETRVVVEADLAAQRVEIALGLRCVVADAMERTERAQHLAERHVHVQLAGRRRRGGHDLRGVVLGKAHGGGVFVPQHSKERALEPQHPGSLDPGRGWSAPRRQRSQWHSGTGQAGKSAPGRTRAWVDSRLATHAKPPHIMPSVRGSQIVSGGQ